MDGPLILLRDPAPPARPFAAATPIVSLRERCKRDRIWELSPTLHCSIIGTCLTSADLRQLFVKLNESDARTATDHTLHARAVNAAGQPGLAAKLLNKTLDGRHAVHVKRFAATRTVAEVRQLWTEALARGDIPGGYWAVMTHPATDRALVQEAFGEVHMLSHLIGTANRADIVRLRELERRLAERDEAHARQQAQLRQLALELVGAREAHARDLALVRRPEPAALPSEEAVVLARKLAAEQARADLLAARVDEATKALRDSEARAAALQSVVATLGAEAQAIEATIAAIAAPVQAEGGDLRGRTILYVGGRPKLVDQLKALTTRQGAVLLAHDGGVEESASLLPGLVSRADLALFPVDCVSHRAAEQVKRLCQTAGKPFLALRTASLASFLAAVAGHGRKAVGDSCC